MDDKELEKKMREEVKQLRRFYLQATYYCLANGLFILIWALSGFGYFWPFWPILLWGALLLVRGEELDFLPDFVMRYARLFRSKLPFLREDWAEAQVKKRMASRRAKNAASASTQRHASMSTTSAKAGVAATKGAATVKAASKPTAKKPAAKKPAATKAAPKKPVAVKKPAAKKAVAKKPVAKKPVGAKAPAKKPATKAPAKKPATTQAPVRK